MNNYNLKPCKNCGDVTCNGKCQWLRPLIWSIITTVTILVGVLVKMFIFYVLNKK